MRTCRIVTSESTEDKLEASKVVCILRMVLDRATPVFMPLQNSLSNLRLCAFIRFGDSNYCYVLNPYPISFGHIT
jgi:hypothetical protein